jgi:Flp pilus assembly protein TadD
MCYSRGNRLAEAGAELERALEYAPDDAEVLYELGLAYEKTTRKDDAAKTLQRALPLSKSQELSEKIRESLKRITGGY